MTAEHWLPIPGSDWYEISDRGNVRSVFHVVIRRNGSPYRVRPRVLKPMLHRHTGLIYVTLAVGRRGCKRTVYMHHLVAELFGNDAIRTPRTNPGQAS